MCRLLILISIFVLQSRVYADEPTTHLPNWQHCPTDHVELMLAAAKGALLPPRAPRTGGPVHAAGLCVLVPKVPQHLRTLQALQRPLAVKHLCMRHVTELLLVIRDRAPQHPDTLQALQRPLAVKHLWMRHNAAMGVSVNRINCTSLCISTEASMKQRCMLFSGRWRSSTCACDTSQGCG
jgi:hypothetical protein